ncbi:MAG: c-type cytochrome, partial [Pseudomonadota bacterium]
MAKPVMVIGIALASMVTVSTVLAEPSGEMLSQTCAGCHGTEGKLNGASAFVPLSGMSATSFEKA